MRKLGFGIALIGIVLIGYLIYQMQRALAVLFPRMPKPARYPAALGLVALLGAVPYGVYQTATATVLALAYLAAAFLLAQLLHGVWRLFRKGSDSGFWYRLYRSGVIPILCVAALFVYGDWNMKHVVQTEYILQTKKPLPGGEYVIAMISDVHYGTVLETDQLTRVAEEVGQQGVDAVVLCGDIVDESTTLEEMKEVFCILGGIPARDGVYFVFGNHDRTLYRNQPHFNTHQLVAAIEDAGIVILQDQAAEIAPGVLFVGREDRGSQRATIGELLSGADLSKFLVVLDHQPTQMQDKSEAGVDLQLSGHTHGGQFFPGGWFNTMISTNEVCYGLAVYDQMNAIVTSGLSGWGLPLRTQGHSEYVLIRVETVP